MKSEAPGQSVLLIEDNPGDARLIREMLAEDPASPFHITVAERLSRGLEVLALKETELNAKEIDRCVEDDGSDLRDNASPLLRRLRKELRGLRHTVVEELRRLARAPGMREHLQEDFVTQRGGRPVLALKASARRSVQGIVHDASGSGLYPAASISFIGYTVSVQIPPGGDP